MADQVTVTIKRDPQNPRKCLSVPNPFHVKAGGDIKFVFEVGDEGAIDFGTNSPFKEATFKIGKNGVTKTVRDDVSRGPFPYTVTWTDNGTGNGSGRFP